VINDEPPAQTPREFVEAEAATADSNHDWSLIQEHLREPAKAFQLATTKASAILQWIAGERVAVALGSFTPNPLTINTLQQIFEELADACSKWMESCLIHEAGAHSGYVDADNHRMFQNALASLRTLGRESLSQEEMVVGLHMFLIGVSSVSLEESPYASLRQSKNRQGRTTACDTEVDQIVTEIDSFEFDHVLTVIRDRVDQMHPSSVFKDVDDDTETIYWKTRSDTEAKLKFDSLKRKLREKKRAAGSNR
jgi:hypothetical protein